MNDGQATADTAADAFIARWQSNEGGAERANYALFLTELCTLIGVDASPFAIETVTVRGSTEPIRVALIGRDADLPEVVGGGEGPAE